MIGEIKINIKLPMPNYGQRYVLANMKRYNYILAGRRWRKSTLGIIKAIEDSAKGKRIIFGSPIYRQARLNFLNTFKCFDNDYKGFNSSNLELSIGKNGIILFRSLENYENLRGDSADLIIIDECSTVNEDAWNSVLRQMLIDTKGQAIFLGTPKGKNWVYNNFQDALVREDSFAIQIPTLGCKIDGSKLIRQPSKLENVDIEFGEIIKEFESSPIDVFRQEILAEFLDNDSLIFRFIDDVSILQPSNTFDHKDHNIVAGIDLAKESDFSVISVICADCKKELFVDRFNKIDWNTQAERFKNTLIKYNVRKALIDYTGIGSVFTPQLRELCDKEEQLYDFTLDEFLFTASSKNELIGNMILVFDKTEYEFIDNPIFKKELYNFGIKNGKYQAIVGNDDTVIGRALALKAAKGQSYII